MSDMRINVTDLSKMSYQDCFQAGIKSAVITTTVVAVTTAVVGGTLKLTKLITSKSKSNKKTKGGIKKWFGF